ncbi:hypothetical protein M885DRAFT_126447, partial [Pelagophyceae sp. CCMP2097]
TIVASQFPSQREPLNGRPRGAARAAAGGERARGRLRPVRDGGSRRLRGPPSWAQRSLRLRRILAGQTVPDGNARLRDVRRIPRSLPGPLDGTASLDGPRRSDADPRPEDWSSPVISRATRYDAVAYYATGSSTGKDSIVKAAVDFAGSDSLLKDSDYTTAPDLQMYPATAAAVVPVVHLPSLDAAGASLVVDRVTLPLIFLGDIFEWTDSRILALQSPQTRALLQQMPDVTIRVVVRDDGSGTTEIFTKALSAFSSDFTARVGGNDILDWCEDGMDKLPCPGNTFTDGACDSNPDKFNCYGGKV